MFAKSSRISSVGEALGRHHRPKVGRSNPLLGLSTLQCSGVCAGCFAARAPRPNIGEHREARCSLGSLEGTLFEMLFVQRHPAMVLGWTRRKAMTVRQTGPPGDE